MNISQNVMPALSACHEKNAQLHYKIQIETLVNQHYSHTRMAKMKDS